MSENSQTSGKPMCMMMLDMDHFKEVNDTYGHPAGDAVLKTLANTLKSSFRVTDHIARYGGEEFVVLLGNIDLEAYANVAEKIRIAIEEVDFIITGQSEPLKKTASIGIAELEAGESVEDFITRADRAMYEAK
jgi:two-component system cell cycle response regulator